MKKIAFTLILTFATSAVFAGGCWQNGKYRQCVKNAETMSQKAAL